MQIALIILQFPSRLKSYLQILKWAASSTGSLTCKEFWSILTHQDILLRFGLPLSSLLHASLYLCQESSSNIKASRKGTSSFTLFSPSHSAKRRHSQYSDCRPRATFTVRRVDWASPPLPSSSHPSSTLPSPCLPSPFLTSPSLSLPFPPFLLFPPSRWPQY